MTSSVVIAERFCGPPGFGNGGYVAGVVAGALAGAVEVTLAAPTPLATPLTLTRDGGTAALHDGATLIARAIAKPLTLEAPPPATLEQARASMAGYAGFTRHAFPHCFVCGPERGVGDGLRIFTGPVEGGGGVAAIWTPARDLVDDDGAVRSEFLWAALDCPGYFAIQPEAGPSVLGRFHGEIAAMRPRVGDELIVMAWGIASGERKFSAGSALYSADGALLARASAVWVRVSPQSRFQVAP